MDILQIVIISFVQGFSEFLPISSSGHLIIFHNLFNNNLEGSLSFDIALHLGTILAIILFFYKDFIIAIKELFNLIIFKRTNYTIIFQLIIATIPAGIIGIIFLKFDLEQYFRVIPVIAFNLIVFGIILYFVDKKSQSKTTFYEISKKKALLIGLAQALALIPGVSRSGICITMARFLNIDRVSSVKFAMMISIPAILGASLISLLSIGESSFAIADFTLGIVLSFIFGVIFIKLLMDFIKKFSFGIFMIYRVVLGIVLFVVYFTLM